MHKHTFLASQNLKAALEINGLLVEVMQFQQGSHLTHAQRNGLDAFAEHLFSKQSILMRSIADYIEKADKQIDELQAGTLEELPF